MSEEKEILNSILHSIQLSEIHLRCAQSAAIHPTLRNLLRTQLLELDAIETEVYSIASHRGWDLYATDPFALLINRQRIHFRLTLHNTDSRIAELMILSSTKTIIHTQRSLRCIVPNDTAIRILCQKLLDCETACSKNLQNYL